MRNPTRVCVGVRRIKLGLTPTYETFASDPCSSVSRLFSAGSGRVLHEPRHTSECAMRPIALALLLAPMLALAGCGGAKLLLAPAAPPPPKGASQTRHGPAYAPSQTARGAPDPATDWAAYNKTRSGNRYSPLTQISAANVTGLKPVCAFPLDSSVNMQSSL